jgi:hypothetical protein
MPNPDDRTDKSQSKQAQDARDEEPRARSGAERSGNAASVTSRRPGEDETAAGNDMAAETTRTVTTGGTAGRNSGQTSEFNRRRVSKPS